ncbi:MAG: DNA alkylation repair protein [Bacteroidota bacterium]|nr:DNA alkylation repair protein [Bacteroidota bacterium]
MTLKEVLLQLQILGSKKNIDGMKRFNISFTKAFGVSAPNIRFLAKEIKKDHQLAIELWNTGYHDARILATLIADPRSANLKLLDQWTSEIENWAQCDACCAEFYQKTKYAQTLPFRWAKRKKEFVRRAGIVMIAEMAVHHKNMNDEFFEQYFQLLKQYSTDDRNFVKKGVNWALRQIGKRNMVLQKKTIALAREIQKIPFSSARWIATDAIRELTSFKTIAIINRRKK